MRQIEEDELQFEQQQEADAAAREFELARQARVTVERKCLTGLVDFSRERRTA